MWRNLTLDETANSLHEALRDYIEATYHISDQGLVDQRRALLEQNGVIRQVSHVESTPRYLYSNRFEELGLPGPALEVLLAASDPASGPPLVFNPPYQHQAESLQEILCKGGSAIVTTGTGSGKTECFLLPILGRLAVQAKNDPSGFQGPAVRALLLYPMNALVNDQLGRLRLLFGSGVVSRWFTDAAGRPARFARYTSRTLYPGVRTTEKDQERLRPLGKYYVANARAAQGTGESADAARKLVDELSRRGKWPAKPDLLAWYGAEHSRWKNPAGDFQRCVTMADDPELLTRHEVLASPPDILVTNYSMLEYMLMRPLEKPLFDATKAWFASHPDETFLLVIDEAHLYRGASGAEVALLLRRLRDRLGLGPERLQVICTTASFADAERAPEFAGRLSGKPASAFVSIAGDLALLDGAASGSAEEASILANVDLEAFYAATDPDRTDLVKEILDWRRADGSDTATALFAALREYPPMQLLVNATMQSARPLPELAPLLFPGCELGAATRATAVLVALGSYARSPDSPNGPGLLPSRLHAFFRGLPGLWACTDPVCIAIPEQSRGGPTGKLFGQPVDRCECGARVFELYTCRHCGSAYCRAYADDSESPTFLWTTQGDAFAGVSQAVQQLVPIDIFMGEPDAGGTAQAADLDLITGRLNPPQLGGRTRVVYLPPRPTDPDETYGEFKPCAVCGKSAAFGRSSVQDHQTKGDEPFQALVSRQVEIQQPTQRPTAFAPMAGRKVLVFSDSRQTAARLAPNLQKYTTRDAVRPLLLYGYRDMLSDPSVAKRVSLEEAYLAVLLAMVRFGVRLRPSVRSRETFEADVTTVNVALADSDAVDRLDLLIDFRARNPPEGILAAIHSVINDSYYGVCSLALATLEPRDPTVVDRLPPIPPYFESAEERRSLVRAWLGMWRGQWLRGTPDSWRDDQLRPDSGRFPRRLQYVLNDGSTRRSFEREWLPVLLAELAEPIGTEYRLRGAAVTLGFGSEWGYCQVCRATQRPIAGRGSLCASCGRTSLVLIDPEADAVFAARKGYYRRASVQALDEDRPPIALVAAEHTAQLNEAQAEAVFSEAEENELLFQDVDLGESKPAIDVLSCTTTMEVGIDIGSLSGVALRNMPPSRANYQQRSGRAGRRGRAIATVTAFAGSQSHDEHAFGEPEELIRGRVIDPEMSLDNWQIASRHLLAFVLQEYVAARLGSPGTGPDPESSPSLFEVLGTVGSFSRTTSPLNLVDFRDWLVREAAQLAIRAQGWLPRELSEAQDAEGLARAILGTALDIERAITAADGSPSIVDPSDADDPAASEESEATLEIPAETDEVEPGARGDPQTLLGRLLYKGLLPRYAFPTDVAAFHVFDRDKSRPFRPAFLYTPSQGMAVALSTYAPGKRVWIGNREWTSGCLYSRIPGERYESWVDRSLYLECSTCHYADTIPLSEGDRGDTRDCPACGATAGLGPAQTWVRPPGFAHPWYVDEAVSPDEEPPTSFATRAKLTVQTPVVPELQRHVTDRVSVYFSRLPLLVTNRGPREDGYTYCTKCGLIEPAAIATSAIVPGHRKPYPDERNPICPGGGTASSVVLGTDFLSDVLLISLHVDSPLTLRPEFESTRVVLRTLSEALTIQALRTLSLGSGELQAEFRPALTPGGRAGTEAEIYMYDTLPGGAGFSQRVGNLGLPLFEDTLTLLESCPAHCDSSCYRCLRSYKNQFEHGLLDRHLGASLLRYLLTSEEPRLDATRSEESTNLLFGDLQNQGLTDLRLARAKGLEVPGFGTMTAPILAERQGRSPVVIALHHPSAPGLYLQPDWSGPAEYGFDPEVYGVDELAVRRNLPWASATVLKHLGY